MSTLFAQKNLDQIKVQKVNCPPSQILSAEAIEFIEEAVAEQRRLFSRKGRSYPSSVSFLVVMGVGKTSVRVKANDFDQALNRVVDVFGRTNPHATHGSFIIFFKWDGCSHWRTIPDQLVVGMTTGLPDWFSLKYDIDVVL